MRDKNSILVLSAHNSTVDAMRAFLGRTVPIWEGHVRDGLSALVEVHGIAGRKRSKDRQRRRLPLCSMSPRGFPRPLTEIHCWLKCVTVVLRGRSRKPAKIQTLGRVLLEEPNHKGVARFLVSIEALARTDPDFDAVELDCHREFWDAVRLGEFERPSEGFAEISRRRSSVRQSVPAKALSTIHKAKGLECGNVLIVPCDAAHFGDTHAARCSLYVGMSRATRSLSIVVSRNKPSPLIVL